MTIAINEVTAVPYSIAAAPKRPKFGAQVTWPRKPSPKREIAGRAPLITW